VAAVAAVAKVGGGGEEEERVGGEAVHPSIVVAKVACARESLRRFSNTGGACDRTDLRLATLEMSLPSIKDLRNLPEDWRRSIRLDDFYKRLLPFPPFSCSLLHVITPRSSPEYSRRRRKTFFRVPSGSALWNFGSHKSSGTERRADRTMGVTYVRGASQEPVAAMPLATSSRAHLDCERGSQLPFFSSKRRAAHTHAREIRSEFAVSLALGRDSPGSS
jgi:hypothetical protein